jgi:hypothetical protein
MQMGLKLCLKTLAYNSQHLLCKIQNSENLTHLVTTHLVTETQHSGNRMTVCGLESFGLRLLISRKHLKYVLVIHIFALFAR